MNNDSTIIIDIKFRLQNFLLSITIAGNNTEAI